MADLKKDNEKLSREVGSKDGLADTDLSCVAGGDGGDNGAYSKFVKNWAAKAKKDGSIAGANLGGGAGNDGGAYSKFVSGLAKKAKKDGLV